MSGRLRVMIVKEDNGWGAGVLDHADFSLVTPTWEEMVEQLAPALRARFGAQVQFRVLNVRFPDKPD